MGNAPDALLRLVDRFDQDRKVFLSGDYKEEQPRAEFLNPFFTAPRLEQEGPSFPLNFAQDFLCPDCAARLARGERP